MSAIKKFATRAAIASIRTYLNGLSLISEKKAGKKAVEIFSSPRKGRTTERDLPFLQTAEWSVLPFGKIKIQCYFWKNNAAPDAETILLAHGWESNSARWQPLIQQLKKAHFNVVAMDAPAHGGSGSRFFNAFLYAEMMNVVVEKFQPSAIVGHSVGGFATAYFAAHFDHPSVKRLVLMAVPSNLRQIFDAFLRILNVNDKVQKAYYAYFSKIVGQTVDDLTAEKFVGKLNLKGFIIHDKTDNVAAYNDGVRLHAAFRNAKFLTSDGAGHSLRGSAIQKAVVDFLKETATPPTAIF